MPKNKLKLEDILSGGNLADLLDDQRLAVIGGSVLQNLETDEQSRSEWAANIGSAVKLAEQVLELKNTPWPGASNVKYPLITQACIQFAARAYPEIVRGEQLVKAKVIGRDPDGQKKARGERISRHMSYQLMEQMTEWEEEFDQLLHVLPVYGTLFKKSYYDSQLKRNVSRLVLPQDLIVNDNARDLESARRISHLVRFYKNDVVERQRMRIFRDVDLKLSPEGNDQQPSYVFVEQHCWIDLDGDEYEEPYIVTVAKDTAEVVRIVPRFMPEGVLFTDKDEIARISPVNFFTKYQFFPSVTGKFYSIGFGHLLYPINESINTAINQLFDAGSLSNTGGGFLSRDFRLKAGALRFKPGEWKQVAISGSLLKDSIVPLPTPEPSRVLFQLLGFMVDAGKSISNVSEVMTGEQPGANVPATTVLALIEQGLKVFSAIYKRVYRSLKQELVKLESLNAIYLQDEEYYRVLDEENLIARADYSYQDCDIVPTADPNSSTDLQQMIRAEATMKVVVPGSGVDPWEATRRYLEAIKIENIDQLQPPKESQPPPPPDPKVVEAEMNFKLEMERIALERLKIVSQMKLNSTQEILNIAKAEAAEVGNQLPQYAAQAQKIGGQANQEAIPPQPQAPPQGALNDPGRVPAVANQPADAGNFAGFRAATPEPDPLRAGPNGGGELPPGGY